GNGAKVKKAIAGRDEVKVEESSGNVFADLGYPDAEEALAKSRLAQHIADILEKKHLTQVQAARLLGIDQPKVSRLLRGQLREFSTDRLFRFLNALGQDVEIVIKSKPRSRRHATVNVIAAEYPISMGLRKGQLPYCRVSFKKLPGEGRDCGIV